MSELAAFLALSPFVIFLIFLALLFDFLNGMNDAANCYSNSRINESSKTNPSCWTCSIFQFCCCFRCSTARRTNDWYRNYRYEYFNSNTCILCSSWEQLYGQQQRLIGVFLSLFLMHLSVV